MEDDIRNTLSSMQETLVRVNVLLEGIAQKQADTESDLKELRRGYTDYHNKVAVLEDRILGLRQEADKARHWRESIGWKLVAVAVGISGAVAGIVEVITR